MSSIASLAWWFLPAGAEILVILGVGVLMMVGVLSRRRGFGIIGVLALFLLAEPFIFALFNALPLWLCLLVVFAVGYVLLKKVLNVILGKEGAGHVLGHGFLWLLGLPFRVIWGLLRLLMGSGRSGRPPSAARPVAPTVVYMAQPPPRRRYPRRRRYQGGR